jgi:hypothetical protein
MMFSSQGEWVVAACAVLLVGASGHMLTAPLGVTGCVARGALSLLAGILVALTAGYGLSGLGLLSRTSLGGVLLLVAVRAWMMASPPRRRGWLAASVLTGLVVLLVARLPERGAWLVGGWDPGVYANEGAYAARTGGFAPEPVAFFQALGPEVLHGLTTAERHHRELFPGFPYDEQAQTFSLQFPRLTSVAFAVMHLAGGAAAGWRTPLGLAALAAFLGWALAGRLCASRWAVFAAGLALASHPLLLYHSHTPSSELLELVLVLGLLLLRTCPPGTARAWGTAWLLAAAGANRTSFLLWGALWVALVTWQDATRTDRRRVLVEHLALMVALAAGAVSHHLMTPVAVEKLAHVLPRIERVSIGMLGVSLLLDVVLGWPAVQAWWTGRGQVVIRRGGWLGWCLLMGAGAYWAIKNYEPSRAMVDYLGPALLVLALIGATGVMWRGREPVLVLALLWCAAVTVMVVRQPHVAELYPWATKRHLAFGLPLVALGLGAWVQMAMERVGWLRVALLSLVVAALALPMSRRAEAWRGTSYDGVPAALDEVAARLAEADGVVADHFFWATPLAVAGGLPVLNGENLWRQPNAATTRAVWQRVRELAAAGQHLRVLSSVGGGPEQWGTNAPMLRLVWAAPPLRYRETAHHHAARGFATREKERAFRVYEVLAGDGHVR